MPEIQAAIPRAQMVLATAEIDRWRQVYAALLTAAEDALTREVPRQAAVTVLGCRVVLQPPSAPAAAPEPAGEGG